MSPSADYGALLEDAACLLIEVRRVCTGSPPHQIVGDNLNAMTTCPAHIDQAGTPCGANLFHGQLIGERDEDAMAVIARLMGAVGDRMVPPNGSEVAGD